VRAPSRVETAQAQPHGEGDDAGSAGVRRQVLFRQVNEEIRQMAASFAVGEELELVCECEHGDCFAFISVSRDDYEAVRRFPTRFLAKPDHVSADERVVQEAALFVVIEKVGAGAKTAILRDPRGRASGNPTIPQPSRRTSSRRVRGGRRER
jgi:hypothetical protein